MIVRELIEILRDHPPELEVELVIVCPVESPEDPVAVDRYGVDVVLRWEVDDEDDDGPSELLWLVGGEEDDVEAFADAAGLADEQPGSA